MHWILIAAAAGAFGFTATFDDKPACEAAAAKFLEEAGRGNGRALTAFCTPSSSTRQN